MINTDHLSPDAEALATELENRDDYRVLRRVPKPFPSMPHMGPMPDGRCIAIVDTETSGLSAENDVIIELAIMLCFVDDHGEAIAHFGPFSWLQDPGRELDPKISLITGLGAQHLKRQKINDTFARGLLDRADLIVAHNSSFDSKFIERRYPDLVGKAWACSCSEIDWLKLGADGRSQSALLNHLGWFSAAHRAAADVWALFWILQHRQRDPGGGPIRTGLIGGKRGRRLRASAEHKHSQSISCGCGSPTKQSTPAERKSSPSIQSAAGGSRKEPPAALFLGYF